VDDCGDYETAVEEVVGESSGIPQSSHFSLFRRRTSVRIADITADIQTEYSCAATSDTAYIIHALEGRSCSHITCVRKPRETTKHVTG
jgi:hypothetical protein